MQARHNKTHVCVQKHTERSRNAKQAVEALVNVSNVTKHYGTCVIAPE